MIDGNILLALVLTFLLGIIDFISEGRVKRGRKTIRAKFISFAAGLSVTYIFLHLFPIVYSNVQTLPRFTFLSMLAGFVTYHVVEKWIYQHTPRDEIIRKIELEHSITLFFYHFSVGIVFVPLIKANLIDGLLYFLPVSFHVIINALPHSHKFQKRKVRAFFTSAPFLGAVFALLMPIPQVVYVALLGMVAGILLFIEVREIIPKKRKGSPVYFLLGVLFYGMLIMGTWLF